MYHVMRGDVVHSYINPSQAVLSSRIKRIAMPRSALCGAELTVADNFLCTTRLFTAVPHVLTCCKFVLST
jgi:hypothetical protein